MSGTLRDIREIETDIEAAGLRGITKQQILDILRSQAKTGGAMSINGGSSPGTDITIAGGWNRIDVWERSIDTQGVQDGLTDITDPGGWYRVTNAAKGDYSVASSLRIAVDTDGEYEIRVAQVEADATVKTTPYHDAVTLVNGETGHLAIANGVVKDMLVNERLQLEIRGPNGAVVTITFGQFGIWR